MGGGPVIMFQKQKVQKCRGGSYSTKKYEKEGIRFCIVPTNLVNTGCSVGKQTRFYCQDVY